MMEQLIQFYSLGALYSGVALILEMLLQMIFGKKELAEKNRSLAVISLSGIVFGFLLFLIFGVSSIGYTMDASYNLPLSIVIFLILAAALIYSTVLTGIGIFLRIKKKESIPAMRFGSLDDRLKALKQVELRFHEAAKTKVPFGKRILMILIPAFSFVYMTMVFSVFESFFANLNDLSHIAVSDFIRPMLTVSLLVLAVLVFGGALLFRGTTCKGYAVLLSVLCVISYLQNAMLNRREILDGQDFNYNANCKLYGIADLFLWIGALILVFRLFRRFQITFRIAEGAAALLLIMQTVPLAVLFVQAPQSALHKGQEELLLLDGSGEFQVSSDRNITVFIMDTFSKEDMDEILNRQDSYSEVLSDFICFDNIGTSSYFTAFSMPEILTAGQLDYSYSLVDAGKQVWNNPKADLFYQTLHEQDYKVRLYTDSTAYCGGAENIIGKIDNIEKSYGQYDVDGLPTYLEMLKMSFYKYMPNTIKNCFFVAGPEMLLRYTKPPAGFGQDLSDWTLMTSTSLKRGVAYMNGDVLEGFRDNSSETDQKLVSFIHTYGMHKPYSAGSSIDENGSKEETQKVCMDILLEYLEKLKAAGSYDNSTVILTADHGKHSLYECSPVMLVKPSGHHGDCLAFNSAPGDLQKDMLPTLFDCIGEDWTQIGSSFLSMDENEERDRFVKEFMASADYPDVPKISAIGKASYNCYNEYQYTGRVEDKSRYVQIGTYPITDYWW